MYLDIRPSRVNVPEAELTGVIFFCHHKRLHTETIAISNLKQIHFNVKLFSG